MATRDEYLARTQGYKRPAINFNQRDNIRDFARSGHGQNYNRMMDIQRQLPNMDRSDPMVQEFKDRRRTLNRYGKNPMGEMLGYTPHEMMDKYVDLSRDVRQTNKPVYNKMYPFTGGFMDYMDQGATLGMLKNAATDILSNVGIGGALDTNEEELKNYANLTYPQDVHPTVDTENWDERENVVIPPDYPIDEGAFTSLSPFDDREREEAIRRQYEITPAESLPIGSPNPQGDFPITYPQDKPINTDMTNNKYYNDLNQAEIDYLMGRTDSITDEEMNIPEPFDDSARERAIMEQYPESFIGPPIDPSWRPNMMDVAGKGINRGLFPYPGYNEEVTKVPPPFYGGRGEMPGMDSPYYYDQMREGYGFGNLINEDDGASFFDTTKKKFKNRDEYNDWLNMKRQYGLR